MRSCCPLHPLPSPANGLTSQATDSQSAGFPSHPRSRRAAPKPLQVGRSLALLGKHRQAVEVYDEAMKLAPDDWELWHSKGLCCTHLQGQQDT